MTNLIKRNKNINGGLATLPDMSFGSVVDSVLQNTLNRFFDDDVRGFSGISSDRVPVNIRETDKTYEMEVVAPGLQKDDFHVGVSDNLLTISFEHKEEDKQANRNGSYLRQEYRRLAFSRSFMLDDTVEADKITARYKDGILHLSLPKKEGAQRITKNIEVK